MAIAPWLDSVEGCLLAPALLASFLGEEPEKLSLVLVLILSKAKQMFQV